MLHWGASLQFSTYYLTSRFTPATCQPRNPSFSGCRWLRFPAIHRGSGKTGITVLPGIAYIGETYQVAAELIVPLNREAGRGAGFKVNLLLFIDDLVPSIFGKPVFGE